MLAIIVRIAVRAALVLYATTAAGRPVLADTLRMTIKRLTIVQNSSLIDCHVIYNAQNISTLLQTLVPFGSVDFRIALDVQPLVEYGDGRTAAAASVGFTNYLDQTLDYCAFLGGTRGGSSLLSFVYGTLLYQNNSNTHLPDRCPIQPDLYYTKDYALSNDLYPKLMPKFNFRLTLELFLLKQVRLRALSIKLRGIVTTVEKKFRPKRRRTRGQ